MWTRRRTVIAGVAGAEDWEILRRGQRVGRVYAVAGVIAGSPPWHWSVLVQIPAGEAHGRAVSLTAALDAVRATIRDHWPDESGRLPSAGG